MEQTGITAYLQDGNKETNNSPEPKPKAQDSNYYADALNDNNVNEIIGDEIPHVIILIGFPEYGKSTFVASLYHKILTDGKIGKYKFIDSDTLVGFERRALIRKLETHVKERIDRTPVYADYFLSLLFENEENHDKTKIVISDRSGEAYKEYTTSESAINGDKALKYASHIVFFLDATKIASDDFYDTLNDLRQLVTRMYNYGVFNTNKVIDIVYNKIDRIDQNSTEAFNANKDIIERIITQRTKINESFKINSKSIVNNSELNSFFQHLIDVVQREQEITEDAQIKLNWINNIN